MFTVADPRPTPTAPVDLPQMKTGPGGPGASRAPRASRLSRTAPEVMRGHHASLLAALREEDTDDEFDDDAFAFVPKGQETPSTPRGAHRVFTAGKESTDSPTSPLVTHTKKEPHTMTYGFAPPAGDAGGAPRAATPPPPPALLAPTRLLFAIRLRRRRRKRTRTRSGGTSVCTALGPGEA
mmetsp:Transcript_14262/g.61097  ORF Transcript_14262/g.61097 Transcript_14262/m.61097 type:complete len:181 (-) Transcript_14262:334-876(-)